MNEDMERLCKAVQSATTGIPAAEIAYIPEETVDIVRAVLTELTAMLAGRPSTTPDGSITTQEITAILE